MNKITLVSAVLVSLALTGCGAFDRGVAKMAGSAESCVDGVSYLQFASGVTVKYAPDGGIARCDGSSSGPTRANTVSNQPAARLVTQIPN